MATTVLGMPQDSESAIEDQNNYLGVVIFNEAAEVEGHSCESAVVQKSGKVEFSIGVVSILFIIGNL